MTSRPTHTPVPNYTAMMLDHTIVGMAVFDAHDFRLLEANKAFLYQFERFAKGAGFVDKIMGQSIQDWNPELEGMGVIDNFRHVVESGKPYRGREFPYPTKLGMTYWNWALAPALDADGRVTHIILSMSDVTEVVVARQRAEQVNSELSQTNTLVEAERKRLEAIETVARSVSESLDPLHIGNIALDAICTHFNAPTACIHTADSAHQFLRLLCERSPVGTEHLVKEMTYIPYENSPMAAHAMSTHEPRVIEDVREAIKMGLMRENHPLVQMGAVGYVCLPLWFGDGFEGTLCVNFRHRIDPDGPEVRVLKGISAHIAAALSHARLHATVDNERSRLTAVLDQLPEGILIAEVFNGIISYANPAAANILGIPLKKLVSVPLHRHPWLQRYNEAKQDDTSHLPPWNFLVIRALVGEKVTGRETLVTKECGEQAITLASSAPLYNDQGIMTGAIIVFQDVTNQKTLEQHKNEFLSVANHELRTPITIIQGFAEILQMQTGHSAQMMDSLTQYALTNITDQSQHLIHLIEEMLDITRIEQSQFTLNRATRNLVALLNRVIESQSITTRQHILDLVLEELPDKHRLAAFIDEKRIVQVFNNLIGNAIKYSPSGGRIEIGLHHMAEQQQALIWVKDQGIGISPDEIPLIFERFHRASNQDRSVSGFGIGLYLVKEVITRHGGRVWVESTLNKGSTFYITLPLSKPE